MKQIQSQYGGGVITEPQLEAVFHQWLPNQAVGCHTLLDQFFTQWFDTPYPPGGDSNKPQITGPGLNGPGFYNDSGACTRADQAITFGLLPDKSIGDPDFTVSATSDSGLTVSFAASGQCTISGTTVHITGLGSCTITVTLRVGQSSAGAGTLPANNMAAPRTACRIGKRHGALAWLSPPWVCGGDAFAPDV